MADEGGSEGLEELIAEFLGAVVGFSLREAAELSGVPHATIGDLRNGLRPELQPRTQRKMRAFIDQKRQESTDGPIARGAGYRLLREYLDATPQEQAQFLAYLEAIRRVEEGQ